jgi:hypothetical protein
MTEEEIEEETGVAVKYPLDQKGAEILLITPSADFFAEPHIEGLIGYGKVFHQDGVSWNMSSYASEGYAIVKHVYHENLHRRQVLIKYSKICMPHAKHDHTLPP